MAFADASTQNEPFHCGSTGVCHVNWITGLIGSQIISITTMTRCFINPLREIRLLFLHRHTPRGLKHAHALRQMSKWGGLCRRAPSVGFGGWSMLLFNPLFIVTCLSDRVRCNFLKTLTRWWYQLERGLRTFSYVRLHKWETVTPCVEMWGHYLLRHFEIVAIYGVIFSNVNVNYSFEIGSSSYSEHICRV